MNRTLRTALAAIALSLLSIPAFADPGAKGGRHDGGPPMMDKSDPCYAKRVAPLLKQFDADKDGTLSREEMRAVREQHEQAMLARYDADKDGELSRAEHQEARRGEAIEHFEELDTNHDGDIARAEATGSCTPLDRNFERADADQDGAVSWDEFEAAMKKHHGRHRGPHGPRDEQGRRDGKAGKAGKVAKVMKVTRTTKVTKVAKVTRTAKVAKAKRAVAKHQARRSPIPNR